MILHTFYTTKSMLQFIYVLLKFVQKYLLTWVYQYLYLVNGKNNYY